MADEPGNLIIQYHQRTDAKVDRVIDHFADLKLRMIGMEARTAQVELYIAGVNRRIDQIDTRLDRIERRFDLVDQPH